MALLKQLGSYVYRLSSLSLLIRKSDSATRRRKKKKTGIFQTLAISVNEFIDLAYFKDIIEKLS